MLPAIAPPPEPAPHPVEGISQPEVKTPETEGTPLPAIEVNSDGSESPKVAEPAEAAPDLYFELRRNGQPINPRNALPALDGKGQG